MSVRDTPVPPAPPRQQVRATSRSQEMELVTAALHETPSRGTPVERLNELRRKTAREIAEEVAQKAQDSDTRRLAQALVFLIRSFDP